MKSLIFIAVFSLSALATVLESQLTSFSWDPGSQYAGLGISSGTLEVDLEKRELRFVFLRPNQCAPGLVCAAVMIPETVQHSIGFNVRTDEDNITYYSTDGGLRPGLRYTQVIVRDVSASLIEVGYPSDTMVEYRNVNMASQPSRIYTSYMNGSVLLKK